MALAHPTKPSGISGPTLVSACTRSSVTGFLLTHRTSLLRDAANANGMLLTLRCRTLDIIHVAAALVLGTKEFVTFDARQGALAKLVGLTVRP